MHILVVELSSLVVVYNDHPSGGIFYSEFFGSIGNGFSTLNHLLDKLLSSLSKEWLTLSEIRALCFFL